MADIDVNSDEFLVAVTKAVEGQVSGLKENFSAIKNEKKALQEKLQGYAGMDPEKYSQMLKDAEERDAQNAKKLGDWDKREAQLTEGHKRELKRLTDNQATELEAAKNRNTVLDGALHQVMIEGEAVKAISTHKGSIKLLLPHVKSSMKMIEEDGQFTAVVVDDKGGPVLAKGAKSATDYMTVNDFVGSLRESDDFARAFDGSGSTGGGASEASGGTGSLDKVDIHDPVAIGRNLDKLHTGKAQLV